MKAKSLRFIIIGLLIITSFYLIPNLCIAQYWTALPPYNVLWPLWSPALSPPGVGGVPTPLLTSLTKNTILPVQPSLVWDPSYSYFYLLYNYFPSPGVAQVLYYNPLKAGLLNPFTSWPPSDLLSTVVTPTGITSVPAPIALPLNYATLLSFDPGLWLDNWVPVSNIAWQAIYGINPNLLAATALYPPNYVYTATYLPGAPVVPTLPVPGPGGGLPVLPII